MPEESTDTGAATGADDTSTQGAEGAQQTDATSTGAVDDAIKTPWGDTLTKQELEDFRNDQKWKDANRRRGEELNAREKELEAKFTSLPQQIQDGVNSQIEKMLAEQDAKDAEEAFKRELEELEESDPEAANSKRMFREMQQMLQEAKSASETSKKTLEERFAALEAREQAAKAAEHQRLATKLATDNNLGDYGAPLIIGVAQALLQAQGPEAVESGITPEILQVAAKVIDDQMVSPLVQQRIAAKAGAAKDASDKTAVGAAGGLPAQTTDKNTGSRVGDPFTSEDRASAMQRFYEGLQNGGNLPG